MARRVGVQTEVVLSLALVMLLATLLLTAVLVGHHERSLRRFLGRSLLEEAQRPRAIGQAVVAGTQWWLLHPDGRAEGRNALAGGIDAESRALAERARASGRPLLQPGAVWGAIRLAAPLEQSEAVVVGRLPREASLRLRLVPLGVIGAVLVVDVLVFGALGAYLLRRRVVVPLQRLAQAAQQVAEGARETRVAEEGTREAAEVARAFNDMNDALGRRSEALEKAVVDLRSANQDLRRARAGLDRSERLAAVGQLAAGVAHEIGNPIGAILALLDLAGRDPSLGEAARKHLERAGREGERVRTILRQLLDFSRPPQPAPAPLDLVEAAEQAVALVSAQRRYAGIRFEVACPERPPLARADRSAVSQILLNLLLNAAAALEEQPEPRVLLRIGPALRERRAEDRGEEAAARRSADAVECLVADNGPGIPEELRNRIFDPFFTTKPPGEGTGLGLANAARLAEDQEGLLELAEPPPGLRTAFRLCLPSLQASADARARRSA